MKKILITPRSFGKGSDAPFQILKDAGIDFVMNPYGSIMTEEQLVESIADCDGVILGVDPMTERVMKSAKSLKVISKYGVGLDNIDLDAAKAHNIAVTKTVGANSSAVADYAFTLMMCCARRVLPIDKACRAADWSKQNTLDIAGATLGLIGLGAISKEVVKRAEGFSMRIKAFDVFWDDAYAAEHHIEKATVEEICRSCDFISLHVPLLPETKNIIGEKELAMMKPTAILVNTARGGLVDEAALLKALRDNKIYGAGIDCFSTEPPTETGWFALDNVVVGTHCAASTAGAVNNMGIMAVQNVIDILSK